MISSKRHFRCLQYCRLININYNACNLLQCNKPSCRLDEIQGNVSKTNTGRRKVAKYRIAPCAKAHYTRPRVYFCGNLLNKIFTYRLHISARRIRTRKHIDHGQYTDRRSNIRLGKSLRKWKKKNCQLKF